MKCFPLFLNFTTLSLVVFMKRGLSQTSFFFRSSQIVFLFFEEAQIVFLYVVLFQSSFIPYS